MASTIDLTSPSPDSTGMRLPGAQTLSQLAEKRVLESLSEAVEGYQSTASYCCGGSLPITMPSLPPKPQYVVPIANKPPKTIALRWDMPEHDGSAQKVEFPLAASDIESTKAQALFEQLLKTCAPATFGRNNEDILDESYRKAGKLDRDQFSVDFHPHDYAIIDAIGQILLPQINVGFLKERDEHRGVLAELYKVNVSHLHCKGVLQCLRRGLQDLFWPIRQISSSCRHSSRSDPVRFACCLPSSSP